MRDQWNRHREMAMKPEEAFKCLWMLAGVVNYKLCDREYECERCPFDRALRGGAPLAHADAGTPRWSSLTNRRAARSTPQRGTAERVRGFRLPTTLFYHPGHVWVRVEARGDVRIGLDDFGQRLVGRIHAVRLPPLGTEVMIGHPCWRIGHRAGETMLVAPITGIISCLNERLSMHPSLINLDPYGQGWAVVIRPTELIESLKLLHYGQQAKRWLDDEIRKLWETLVTLAPHIGSRLGRTLQDGGSLVEDLDEFIRAPQWRDIVHRFFSVAIGQPLAVESRARADGDEGR